MSILNGLVGYWKLDELSGQIKDSSGKGHHTNLLSGVTLGVDGKINKCATFASANLARIPFHTDFNYSTFSICAWYKIDNGDVYVGDRVIFAQKDWYDGQTQMPYSFEISYGFTQIRYNKNGGSSEQVGDGSAQRTPVGEWHHVAVTFSPTQVIFYYDGALTANNTGTTYPVYGQKISPMSADPFGIGVCCSPFFNKF